MFNVHKRRVMTQKLELDSKIDVHIMEMHEESYSKLSPTEQGLMMVQLVAMENYSSALGRRIKILNDDVIDTTE